MEVKVVEEDGEEEEGKVNRNLLPVRAFSVRPCEEDLYRTEE